LPQPVANLVPQVAALLKTEENEPTVIVPQAAAQLQNLEAELAQDVGE